MVKFIQEYVIRKSISISSLFLFFSLYSFAFQQLETKSIQIFETIDSSDCGQFRTQTIGGWGSNAAGNNPGVYRDLHFDQAFPNGLSIGCDYTLTLTTSAAVQSFLPSGGTASILNENLIDPSNYNNVLAAQLVALRLSVTFDEVDSDFSPSTVNLGDMIINSGDFIDWTVYEVIDAANALIGNCDSDYTASQLNDVLTSINENYVDGTTDGGALDCPEEDDVEVNCTLSLENVNSYCDADNSYVVEITIAATNGSYIVEDSNALSGNGDYICLGDSTEDGSIPTHTFMLSYANSDAYSVSIYAMVPSVDGCVEAINSDECTLSDISGDPPICCDFMVICPDDGQMIFSCLDNIPDADTSLISYSNNCGPVTIGVSESIEGEGCSSDPYYIVRTYYVSDGTSNFTCVYNYIVIDTSPPVIICPAADNVECNVAEIIPQNWATATDNCDHDVTITYVNLTGESCNSFTRVWTATDDCGNSASCNQIVYTTDTTAPTLSLPEDATVDCMGDVIPNITGTASATDVCSEVTISYEDGIWNGDACFSTMIRTWTATDACGNFASGQQTINREDNVGPLLMGVPGGGYMQCGEIPEAPLVVAYDVCQEDSVEVILTETIYGGGCNLAIFRTWTAMDSCGNTSSATRAIYINDTEAPLITCPDSVILNCGDPVPDTTTAGVATAYDNCSGDDITITFYDGPLNNDCPPSIHRTWSAMDTCGNTSSCIQVISFIDTEAPEVECVDDITVNCSMGNTSPLFTGTPNVLGDCSDVTLDYTDGEYSGDCPVSFTRTWVASDACGNTTICEQVITVIDEMPPSIYCPADKTVECGSSTAPESTGYAAGYDNCLSVSVSYVDGDMSGECPVTFVRTWTATDYCGNAISCDQMISIEDNTAPVIVCPDEISLACDASDLSDAITGIPEVIDACSTTSLSFLDTPIEGDCPKFFYRLWIAEDACGNFTQCSQLVNLVDDEAPVLDCPEDVVVSCDDSTEPEFTGTATANDVCSDYIISYTDSLVNTGDGGSTGDCGQFRTQTQGGWGSRASGDNPGTYRDANFDLAFPNGLVVGCDFTLTLSTSLDVEKFLPAGGTAGQLTIDLLNPSGYSNTLAAQLVALTLSVGFDNYDPEFSPATISLSQLIIGSGAFAGWTIEEVLLEANNYIGQCESTYSASELNDVLTSINENFVDGIMDGGFLLCDEESDDCFTIYRSWSAIDACGNESTCTQIITASSSLSPTTQIDNVENQLTAYPSPTLGEVSISSIYPMMEGDIMELYDLAGILLMKYTIVNQGEQIIDLSNFNSGIYVLQWSGKSGSASIRIVKN